MLDILDEVWRNREQIFPRIPPQKLNDYDRTRRLLLETNVAEDRDYQRTFNDFYVMGRRPASWYSLFFGLLEKEKRNHTLKFEDTLRAIFAETKGRVEPSFASKLVATCRPEAPVYDDWVCRNLGIRKPRAYKPPAVRLQDALEAYEKLIVFYREAMPSAIAGSLASEFDRRFPAFAHFTPVKKLDVLLWQMR